MKAAACSCLTVISLILLDRPRESVSARVSSPGTWKTNSASSFSRHSTRRSEPVRNRRRVRWEFLDVFRMLTDRIVSDLFCVGTVRIVFRRSSMESGQPIMTQQASVKHSRNLAEQYALLRKTLAHYLLLQVGTFVSAFGADAIGPAMEILTNKKAELKVQEIRKRSNDGANAAAEALGDSLAESMGETFRSDYDIETGNGFKTVNLRVCGCIESVTAQAEDYGLTQAQAR